MRDKDIEYMVSEHGSSLYRFCVGLSRNKSDADDLYQKTFLRLVEVYQKVDKGKNPRGYLYSIAAGIWKDTLRKSARRHTLAPTVNIYSVPEFADGGDIEDDYLGKELNNFLNMEINRLDDKLKIPLLCSYAVGMTLEEIASTLDIPTGTVKSRLHKARKVLKKRLEDAGYGEN